MSNDPNRILLFAHTRNRPGFHDGDEFKREMYKMAKVYPLNTSIECRKKAYWLRRKMFTEAMTPAETKTIAIFCHGSKHWIYGIGYNRKLIENLALLIHANTENVKIILYACSCGKGKGNQYPIGEVPYNAGVAMMLADELAKLHIRFKIIAHTTRGHTTMNPNVVFIEKKPGSIVKYFPVKRVTWWQGKKDPEGRKRWLKWVKMLRTDPTFRFRFPYMTVPQIHEILDDEQ